MKIKENLRRYIYERSPLKQFISLVISTTIFVVFVFDALYPMNIETPLRFLLYWFALVPFGILFAVVMYVDFIALILNVMKSKIDALNDKYGNKIERIL
jgi:hypothetical protein